MIDAKQLRIGNLLLSDFGCGPEMTPIQSGHDIQSVQEDLDNWRSIPLTPEILGKCGFEWYNVNGSEYHWSAELEQVQFVKSEEASEGYCIFASGINVATITMIYLHQLQNLFYCLTGHELEVKL